MERIESFSFVILILFIISACNNQQVTDPEKPETTEPRDLTVTEELLVEADESFSYDLFRQTVAYDSDTDNVIISPLSVSMALAMTLNGANSETFKDMRETLYLNEMTGDEINQAFQSLTEYLVNVDPQITLNISNSIWHKEDLPVEEDFIENVQEYFEAEISGLDFNDPASVEIINDWVNNNTEGLIETIVDEIPPQIVMYLINAIYFQGDWLSQFDVDIQKKPISTWKTEKLLKWI